MIEWNQNKYSVSPISLLAELHNSQAGSGRHRCPTCAYEQGFNLGSSGYWSSYDEYCNTLKDSEICQLGSIAPSHILSNLGDNQGGTGRHKCTNCAFKKGFEVDVLENGIQGITIEVVSAPSPQENQGNAIITPSKLDFIEKEIRNKHLGLLGELFILKSEIEFLKLNWTRMPTILYGWPIFGYCHKKWQNRTNDRKQGR